MGRPYSQDLRKRAVFAVEREGMSRQAAARRFEVAPSTVIAWVAQYRAKGHIEPGQIGGHKPKTLSGEHRVWLLRRCKAGHFTLRGLVGELACERGLKVDYRSVWEFVHAEGLSFKKNTSARRAGSSRRSKTAQPVGKLSKPH
jgi:putative transposase